MNQCLVSFMTSLDGVDNNYGMLITDVTAFNNIEEFNNLITSIKRFSNLPDTEGQVVILSKINLGPDFNIS